MNKIRENIFLGSKEDLYLECIQKNKITAILNVSSEQPSFKHKSVKSVKVGFADNAPEAKIHTDEAVAALKNLVDAGEIVLIHCSHGKSRSPHVLASYLAQTEDKDYFDVYNEIRELRPKVMKYSIGQEILDRNL